MISENGVISIQNSHGGHVAEFRPRFEPPVKAGARMATPPTLVAGKLPAWIKNAKAGARIAYHVGDLASERIETVRGDPEQLTVDAFNIARTARAALHYFEQGVIVLCQIPQRREDGARIAGYHYIAVRTDKPFKENADG